MNRHTFSQISTEGTDPVQWPRHLRAGRSRSWLTGQGSIGGACLLLSGVNPIARGPSGAEMAASHLHKHALQQAQCCGHPCPRPPGLSICDNFCHLGNGHHYHHCYPSGPGLLLPPQTCSQCKDMRQDLRLVLSSAPLELLFPV